MRSMNERRLPHHTFLGSLGSTPSDWLGGPVSGISLKCHVCTQGCYFRLQPTRLVCRGYPRFRLPPLNQEYDNHRPTVSVSAGTVTPHAVQYCIPLYISSMASQTPLTIEVQDAGE